MGFEIKENLQKVRKEIDSAVSSNGGKPVTLIAVSKTKPIEALLEAYKCGVRDFGENKVQEIVAKIDLLPSDARFHMIGHLQKNKVKYIVGRVCMIHSVDSYELACVIDKESAKKNVVTDILLEINIGNEESKFGIDKSEAIDLCKKISQLPNVRVRGLMCVAPYVDDPEENRQYFVEMRQLSIDINSQSIDNIYVDILSMGMSNDYLVAISEGATHVRVGTRIFGERDYSIKEN